MKKVTPEEYKRLQEKMDKAIAKQQARQQERALRERILGAAKGYK